MPSPQITLTTLCESEPNSNSHTSNQTNTQEGWAPFIVVADSLSLVDSIHAPEEDGHAVEEGHDGDDGEGDGGAHGDVVAEVEEGCCNGTEDDGEFELDVVSVLRLNECG